MNIQEKLNTIQDMIEEELQQFADATDMCPYRVNVYWRTDTDGYFYPDCEILISNVFKDTPKPKNK